MLDLSKLSGRAAVGAASLCLAAATTHAQCEDTWLDTSSAPLGGVRDGSIWASVEWDPDGAGPQPTMLVAGGGFMLAGGQVANNVAAWDGAAWQPLGPGLDGEVRALAVYDGELYAGGLFVTSGGQAVNYIAKWNGSAWAPLGGGLDDSVSDLVLLNGALVAVGNFTAADGAPVWHVAQWNGSSWSPFGNNGAIGSINAAEVYNGDLHVTVNGGVERSSGGVWVSLGSFTNNGSPAFMTDLAVYDGRLIAGGRFNLAGGSVPANNIAAWDGSGWAPLGGGVDELVWGLGASNGDLYAGGNFDNAGGAPAAGIAVWNGTGWSSPGGGTFSSVLEISPFGTDTFVGGLFTFISGVLANRGALWDGSSFHAMGPGVGSFRVDAFAEHGGDVFAGGTFLTAGAQTVNGVARHDGAQWQPVGPGLGSISRVGSLATYNGNLIVGGSTLQIPEFVNIVQWDGSAFTALGDGLAGFIEDMEVYNGELIATGQFATSGSTAVNWIARWNGAAWQTLGSGLNSFGYALALYEGDLIVGGGFSQAGGVPVSRIARWNGSAWQSIGDPGLLVVYALTVYDGQLIAAGEGGVAAWDGSQWTTLGDNLETRVGSLAVFGDRLVAGYARDGGEVRHLAVWDGAAWIPLEGGVNGLVSTIETVGETLYVGGQFTSVGDGILTPGWGALRCEVSCEADFDGSGSLSLNDFVQFRNAYVAGDPAADFDGNGTLTLNDFVTFRNAYVAGCP